MPVKDITVLIAHPDDDLLFCWPVLDRVNRIVCASSDRYNIQRAWCKERRNCLRDVGEVLGAEVVIHDNDSEFYRAETRNGSLKRIMTDLLKAIEGAELLFTHNSWGEYFNLDHIICNQIGRMSGLPMLVTDIAQEVNWGPVRPWHQGTLIEHHGTTLVSTHPPLDRARFDSLKAIYDRRGCWTWSHEPVSECGVYRVGV